MSQFVALPSELRLLYSPVAIRLVDDFTSRQPIGRTTLKLQEEGATGPVEVTPFRSVDDVFSYPGLGQSTDVEQTPRDYRVLIESEYYEPTQTQPFPVFHYNDDHPLAPGEYAQSVEDVLLLPNSRYPYGRHVPLLRGKVTLGSEAGPPISKAELNHQGMKAISNLDGEFTLPIRFPVQDTQTVGTSTEENKIRVKNPRGYVKALLKIEGAPAGSTYRVDTIDSPDDKKLVLIAASGSALPSGLGDGKVVTVLSFALRVDSDADNVLDHIHDADPTSGFHQYQKIVIPTL